MSEQLSLFKVCLLRWSGCLSEATSKVDPYFNLRFGEVIMMDLCESCYGKRENEARLR